MSGFKKGRNLSLCITVQAILSCFGITLINPVTCLGWGSEDYSCIGESDWDPRCSAHYFIIHKAIGYLEKEELLAGWPLEEYAPYIDYGAYWADYPYDPIGLKCDWAGQQKSTCDGIHHYYSGGNIYLTTFFDGRVVGNGGGLGAPEYAQTLYDLAVKYWPGGEAIPDIHTLPHLDSGGFMRALDMITFNGFVVGGHPFVYETCLKQAFWERPDAVCTEYRWPGFVYQQELTWREFLWLDEASPRLVPDESIRSALIYLGWAIHLVQDLSTPVHAENKTGLNHKQFEEIADDLIDDDKMSHLPVAPGEPYPFEEATAPGYPGSWDWGDYPASRHYFYKNSTIIDFANEAAARALEAREAIYARCPSVEPPRWWLTCWRPGADPQIQIDLDTSIKLVAGIIYKFFSEIGLQPDRFDQEQSNNTPLTASPIGSGNYQLTIHAPFDDDFYELTVPDDFSEVRIIVNYDRVRHGYLSLGLGIEYQDCEGCPSILEAGRETDNGWIYEEKYVPAGRKYLIHVFAFDLVPFNYEMLVYAGKGDLPPDNYESNNSEAEATDLAPTVCDYTGSVSIHSNSDIDYYRMNASGWSVEAEISFDPFRGDLELYLDGVKATEPTVSADGATKTLRITGCGQSPSLVKVQADPDLGNPNFYDICIRKVPLQDGCPGYTPPEGLTGSGTFTYTVQICQPGQESVEYTATVQEQMFAVLTDESPDEMFWSIAAWLEYEGGHTNPLVVELHCQRGVQPSPAQVTMKVLKPTLDGILWSGAGQGECYCSENCEVLLGFSATAELTSIKYPWCVEPGHGNLTIQGNSVVDSDHDGIVDWFEGETGTNSNSDDTDGDGLLDGTEDANQNGSVDQGESDPRSWDTDRDGVSDGVERGLTSPQGNDTDLAIFVPDDDPSTTTDPTRSDTDHDGLADGEEDANHNGRLDPGETSPLSYDAEVQSRRVIYVDADVIGMNEGSSWANAYNHLQDALSDAKSARRWIEIRVAEGIYKPDQGSGITPADRTATFQLLDNVALKGGYGGFDAADPNARDVETYETILSGEIGIPQYDSDNSYHVVVGSGTDVWAVLDGFTVTMGSADGHVFPQDFGGGMLNVAGRPTVVNCTFTGNSAGQGGALYNGNNSSPALKKCTFSGNRAYHGAAIYNSASNPILTGCTFIRNGAASGGAIYSDYSSLKAINCTFIGNTSNNDGGGIYNCNYGEITMINCMFNGNSAGQHGGGVHNKHSSLTLTNCTISFNSAGSYGGGLSGVDIAYLTLTNCIVWANIDSYGSNWSSQIYNADGPPTVDHCCVQGWLDGLGGVNNISKDPNFIDEDGLDDVAGNADDNLRLSHGSPCVDSGDNAAAKPYIFMDLDYHQRFADGNDDGYVIVDMGAYEYASVAFDHFDKDRGISLTHCAPCALVTSSTLTKHGGTLWTSERNTNIRANGFIDFLDFALMAENWLEDVQ